MNTILCPTDFSKTADNAVKYAANLASLIDGNILLINVLHVPAVDVYSPANVINDVMDVQKKTAEAKLSALGESLSNDFNGKLRVITEFGFAADVICEIAEKEQVDMICMGTTGVGSGLNRFLGSVSYDTSKRSEVPVLVVPEGVEFQDWDKVCLANDKTEPIGEELNILHQLCRSCTPQMDIITVKISERGEYSSEVTTDEGGVRTVLIRATEIARGISQYVDENSIKVLALKRHHRNFFENLLHKSTIKQVLGHSQIPALVI